MPKNASKSAPKKATSLAGARAASLQDARFEPDAARAERLLLKLLSIPGVSGQEASVARYIAGVLRKAGVPAEWIRHDTAHRNSPHGGEVGNLICRLPGTIRGPRRLLAAHMDTVPLCRGVRPVVRGGFIVPAEKSTALGADDRSGVCAVLVAALEIVGRRLSHPPLTLLWTVQEETGLCGARFCRLAMLGKPQLAFSFDGSSPDEITIGATGGYRMDIRVRGRAAHAGVAPEKGVSAIAIASLAVAQLHRDGWHGRVEKDGRLGTSNVGVFRGGDATNVVAPEVEVRAEARSHDPIFRAEIAAAIETAFRDAAAAVRNADGVRGEVEIDGHLDYQSFRLDESEPAVEAAKKAVLAVGGQPTLRISNGGLDANWLSARGIPTVTLGSGMSSVHTVEERLDRDAFRQACRLALRLATGCP
jgi:tripeptide aminopeptidase